MRYLIAAAMAVALGVAVGAIPFVNRHLHWSIWIFVPVSGLILGAGLGWVQARMLRLVQAQLTGPAIPFLALAAAAGYLATDVGVYLTTTLPGGAAGGHPVPLRDVVSFGDFMNYRLSGMTLSRLNHAGTTEVGRTGTTITFLVDLAGAFLGAAGALFGFGEGNPYCGRCRRYQAAGTKAERCLGTDVAEANLQWGGLHAIAAAGDYDGLAAATRDLPPVGRTSVAKITVTEFVCPGCRQGTVLGSVHQRQGKYPWGAVNGLTLRVASAEGQAPRFDD